MSFIRAVVLSSFGLFWKPQTTLQNPQNPREDSDKTQCPKGLCNEIWKDG